MKWQLAATENRWPLGLKSSRMGTADRQAQRRTSTNMEGWLAVDAAGFNVGNYRYTERYRPIGPVVNFVKLYNGRIQIKFKITIEVIFIIQCLLYGSFDDCKYVKSLYLSNNSCYKNTYFLILSNQNLNNSRPKFSSV